MPKQPQSPSSRRIIFFLTVVIAVLSGLTIWDVSALVSYNQKVLHVMASTLSDDAYHSVADLLAQQEMSRWSMLAALAALVGTVVGAFGLLFLAQTLKASLDANTISQDVGKSQSRCYLAVVKAEHMRKPDERWGQDFLWLTFANSGQTPAVNVSYYCEAVLTTAEFERQLVPIEIIQDHRFINGIAAGAVSRVEATCFGITRDFHTLSKRLNKVDDQTLMMHYPMIQIRGVVYYEDVFQQTFQTYFCFIYEGDPRKKFPEEPEDLLLLQAPIPAFEAIPGRPAVD